MNQFLKDLTIKADTPGQAGLQLVTQRGVVARQATISLGDKNVVSPGGLPAGLY